jgi:hypothetical protein
MTQDRIKNPVLMLIRSMLSRIDTMAMYHAKVLGQSGNTVDVQPDDARLPAMSKVPLMHGLPGVALSVVPGTAIMVGWSGGDPAQPYAALWDGSETVTKLTLGSANAVQALVMGTQFNSTLTGLTTGLTTLGAQLTAAGGDPVLASLCSTAAASLTAAGTAVTTAVSTFIGQMPAYLSTVVKTA